MPTNTNQTPAKLGRVSFAQFLRKSGRFTLLELLTVIAIIFILAALLLPALSRAKFMAKIAMCASQQKQQVAALLLYSTDNNAWYPVWHPTYMRNRTWTIHPGARAYGEWGAYLGGTFGDWRDATMRNRAMQCPQGLSEVPWPTDVERPHDDDGNQLTHDNHRAFYSIYSDTIAGITGNSTYLDWTPADKKLTMRKVGDTFTLTTRQPYRYGGIDGQKYNVLISDICMRKGPSNLGDVLQTNHIWGGNRDTLVHMSTFPLYIGTTTGRGMANFALDDGSVSQYSMEFGSMLNHMNMSNDFGNAQDKYYVLPKDWGTK